MGKSVHIVCRGLTVDHALSCSRSAERSMSTFTYIYYENVSVIRLGKVALGTLTSKGEEIYNPSHGVAQVWVKCSGMIFFFF